MSRLRTKVFGITALAATLAGAGLMTDTASAAGSTPATVVVAVEVAPPAAEAALAPDFFVPMPEYASGRVGGFGSTNAYVWIVISYADIATVGAGAVCGRIFASFGYVGVGVGAIACPFVGWQAQRWFDGSRAGNHGVYFDIGIGWNNRGSILRSGRY